jgi:ATP-dependent DNA helicase RecQ
MPVDLDAFLRERFGLPAFRPWQREAIDALLDGPGRVLVVAPTGGGKSLTYQVPGAILEGVTLVLSPLVALMEDQVRALEARGIPATFIASTLDPELRRHRESWMVRGKYKLVYAAPERLASDAFVETLARSNVALVAVDEAHCIAQWGHDFRPDYLRIGALLERLKPPRVLACTATATPAVRREILAQLHLGDACREVLRGFARPNLHLAARSIEGVNEARSDVFEALGSALGQARTPNGAAIVYAATRKQTEQWAETLRGKGWNAASYHAGMDAADRTDVANRFADRTLDVVVATNAFGMGIDRADIRAVIHVQPPSSIEAYYQEVGRAGRDGAEAWGLLLCSGADIALRRRLVTTGSGGEPAPRELAERGWSLFRELLRYLDARSCRHDFILRYFGDEQELLGGCGHCDICVAIDEREVDSLGEAEREEAARTVRMALSAVARARQRAGLVAVAEMLRGIDGERTRRFGFTELSTFGLLRERSHPWVMDLLRAMLTAGWIDLTPTEHPVPLLTSAGAEVMRAQGPVRLALPVDREVRARKKEKGPSGGKAPSNAADALDATSRERFDRLRAHRAQIAKTKGVPAYVVALDRTLVEMATRPPRSPAELLGIFGMGPSRVEQYGDGFLQVLRG